MSTGLLVVSATTARTENDLTGAKRFEDHAIAGMYNFGAVRVSLALRRFEFATSRQHHVLVGAWVPLGVHELKISWHQVRFSGQTGATVLDANSARQLGLGYVHNLSKRSALYGTFSRLNNRGAVAYAVPGGAAGLATGNSSTGFEFGMRHAF